MRTSRQFLELRDNTGDEQRRTHNLNLANWINDLFMRRVERDAAVDALRSEGGPAAARPVGRRVRSRRTSRPKQAGLGKRTLPARELYAQDDAHARPDRERLDDVQGQEQPRVQPDGAKPGRTVHLSNLCTEIIEVTNADEIAVCNLGSINLSRHVHDGAFDFDKLAATVRVAVRQLDRVIDLNYYPVASTKGSNLRWRPVGLGVMGLQDVFFKLRLPFDSPDARVAVGANLRGGVLPRAVGLRRAREEERQAPRVRRDARGRRRAPVRRVGRDSPPASAGTSLRAEIKQHGLQVTRCSARSRRRRRSRRSPAATSASSRRSRTCGSARRCRATFSR